MEYDSKAPNPSQAEQNLRERIQQDLNQFIEERAKGAIFRSGAIWSKIN